MSFVICLLLHRILANLDLGPSLREICAANRSNENQVTRSFQYDVPKLRRVSFLNHFFESVGTSGSLLQQIKALLESVGTSFCPNYVDWLGNGATDSHSRIDDRSVLSKFLQAHPADFSTTKLQVRICCYLLIKS